MKAAADQAGIQLVIRSATRNFEYQRGIWERKWQRPQYMGWQDIDKARDILTYSAMPGASRHHWGTDIDLNSFENEWFTSGEGADIYAWLTAHAADFGFHQVYDDKSTGRTGYELERWHWSYLPTAGPMLDSLQPHGGHFRLDQSCIQWRIDCRQPECASGVCQWHRPACTLPQHRTVGLQKSPSNGFIRKPSPGIFANGQSIGQVPILLPCMPPDQSIRQALDISCRQKCTQRWIHPQVLSNPSHIRGHSRQSCHPSFK